jgi:hypothetical protein
MDGVNSRGFSTVVCAMSRIGPRLGRTGLTLVAVVAFSGVAAAIVSLAGADDGGLAGTMPDDITVTTIGLAAQSCPTLSGPRLAAKLMDSTAMNPRSMLEPAVFTQWAPWPQADASDPAAEIYALAHHMCDLVGQVRGVGGSAWDDALAAYKVGVPAVRQAGGVPATARAYVDSAGRYTVWYERQPGFAASSPASTASAEAVPADLVSAVNAAGSTCPRVTSAQIAGQLMASSGFNVNMRGPDGALGVAQFISSMWTTYAPAGASPWDAPTAIRVLGTATCALVGQLAQIGPDPYSLAVAALRSGPLAVRQAGGVPDVPSVRALVTTAVADASFYRQDPRLGTASTPAPSAPASASPVAPSASAGATPTRTPTGRPTHAAPPPTHGPTAAPTPPSPLDGTGVLLGLDGQCLDNNSSVLDDNNPVQVWACDQTSAQVWTVANGRFQVQGKCLTVPGSGGAGTKLVITTCAGSAAQTWRAGTDHTVRNTASGLCLTATATFTQVSVAACDGRAGQAWTR